MNFLFVALCCFFGPGREHVFELSKGDLENLGPVSHVKVGNITVLFGTRAHEAGVLARTYIVFFILPFLSICGIEGSGSEEGRKSCVPLGVKLLYHLQ